MRAATVDDTDPRYDPRYVVLGIAFDDDASARIARGIVSLSAAMMLLAIGTLLLQIIDGVYAPWLGVVSAVLIPVCGWYGARRRSACLLQVFTVANCVEVIVFVVTVWMSWPLQGSALLWVSFGLGCAMAALQVCGMIWGHRLLQSKFFSEAAMAVPVAVPIAPPAPTQPPADVIVVAQPQLLAQYPQGVTVVGYAAYPGQVALRGTGSEGYGLYPAEPQQPAPMAPTQQHTGYWRPVADPSDSAQPQARAAPKVVDADADAPAQVAGWPSVADLDAARVQPQQQARGAAQSASTPAGSSTGDAASNAPQANGHDAAAVASTRP